MFQPLIVGALAWIIAGPALAVIGTPVELGSAKGAVGTTMVAISFSTSVAATDTIIVAGSSGESDHISSCTDSAPDGANIYTLGSRVPPTGGSANMAWTTPWLLTAHALPGGTITCTWSGHTSEHLLGAVAVPGITGIDMEAANAQADSSITPRSSSGILINPNDELTFFELLGVGEGGDSGFVEDTRAAFDFDINVGTMSASTLRLRHRTPPTKHFVLYAPKFATPYNWGTKAVTFTGPLIPPPMRRYSYASTGSVSMAPQNKPVIWGYQYSASKADTLYQHTLQQLPVTIFRLGVNNLEDLPGNMNYYSVVSYLATHNIKLLLNIKNRSSVLNFSLPPVRSAPPTYLYPPAPVTYESQLHDIFTTFTGSPDLATIGLVTIENEEDSNNDYQEQGFCSDTNRTQCAATALATTGAYLVQLARAVTIAHDPDFGLKIANGGFSSSGVDMWYWYYLYSSGQQYAADQYAAYAFAGARNDGAKAEDLPSLEDLTQPIFGGNPTAYLHMLQITDMTPAIKATGIDYFSVHFFNSNPFPGPKFNAIQAIVQASGLPPVSDAIGIKNVDYMTDPVTADLATASVASVGPTFGMAIASWFGSPINGGNDNAIPIIYLGDPAHDDGDLNPLGDIYNQIITMTYP